MGKLVAMVDYNRSIPVYGKTLVFINMTQEIYLVLNISILFSRYRVGIMERSDIIHQIGSTISQL